MRRYSMRGVQIVYVLSEKRSQRWGSMSVKLFAFLVMFAIIGTIADGGEVEFSISN